MTGFLTSEILFLEIFFFLHLYYIIECYRNQLTNYKTLKTERRYTNDGVVRIL
nr:MAG TPA: hypothetical protein [Caudoviricetes sp.]